MQSSKVQVPSPLILPRPDAPASSFRQQRRQFDSVLQVALPKELSHDVQADKRVPRAEWLLQKEERIERWIAQTAAQHTVPLSYPIWQSWRESPSDSWPTSSAQSLTGLSTGL
jgi:hypothetical protein